jgi:uncharacterized membrane protein YsdA (DUF1294 family)
MSKGYWFLFLFLIPFLGFGIWMGSQTFKTINKVDAAQSWTETPAEVLSCVLKSHRGSKGSRTYCVTGQFAYTFNTKKYRSFQVTFYTDGNDNVGNFHQRIFHQLESARLSKKTLPCWVNPNNPDEAVLIRELRPEMIGFQLLFVVFFGGAALAIMAGVVFSHRGKKPINGKVRMRHSGIHRALLLSGGAVFAAVLWVNWKALVLTGNIASMWYLGLFLIPGVVLIGYGLYAWLRFAKFGVSELMLSPSVIRLRDRINATVLIPRIVEGDFKGRLTCTHYYSTGSGKHRSTHHDVVWSEEMMSGGSPAGEQLTQVNFHFELRGGHVTEDRNDEGYYWRLLVTSDMPGVDYKAEFDIIVEA